MFSFLLRFHPAIMTLERNSTYSNNLLILRRKLRLKVTKLTFDHNPNQGHEVILFQALKAATTGSVCRSSLVPI